MESAMYFENSSALVEYISDCHERYLAKVRNIKEDIDYILSVCFQVIQELYNCIQENRRWPFHKKKKTFRMLPGSLLFAEAIM